MLEIGVVPLLKDMVQVVVPLPQARFLTDVQPSLLPEELEKVQLPVLPPRVRITALEGSEVIVA